MAATAVYSVSVTPPKIQPFGFPSNPLLSTKVIVHCIALDGDEPLTFAWTKDGRRLTSGNSIHIKQLSETVSSLTVLEVGAKDMGNYTCTASNTAGSDSATSRLVVKGELVLRSRLRLLNAMLTESSGILQLQATPKVPGSQRS